MQLTPVTAVGLFVALAGFTLLDRTRRALGSGDRDPIGPRSTDLREHAWKWAVPTILLVFVAAEGNSLASIGWRIESVDRFLQQIGLGFLALTGLNVLTAPLWARVGDGGESLAAGIGSFASLSIPERLFVAFTAGATEETAFHGYALERLLALTGSVPFAGGATFLAFTLGHVGDTWDRHAALRIAQPALVTTLLYLWFRSLPALIAIHALNDAVGLLLAERFDDGARATDGDVSESDTDRSESATDSAESITDPAESVTDSAESDSAALSWLR
ncbi:CPBP family glutamic-type intramembrane protease [Halobellus captivus]|uniref:CPBP family glutamic-type intramembrane protease n=1 Tax=Halobellus captivus TaxID=2592614 RepID=UPI0011A85D65|nr:CPBP family intramembrane glutamic endopeptidase [Halobellus captivus]